MHDPKVVVFDIPAPWISHSSYRDGHGRRWGFDVARSTNPKNPGQRVYKWYRLAGYTLKIAGRAYTLPMLITVWHNEPKGHDSGTICKGMNGTDGSLHNVVWAIKHWRHLNFQVHPYQLVHSWLFNHCEECGRRFRWHDMRIGKWDDTHRVWHRECSNLESLRYERKDFLKYIAGVADWNESWRVKRAVDHYLGMSEIEEPSTPKE